MVLSYTYDNAELKRNRLCRTTANVGCLIVLTPMFLIPTVSQFLSLKMTPTNCLHGCLPFFLTPVFGDDFKPMGWGLILLDWLSRKWRSLPLPCQPWMSPFHNWTNTLSQFGWTFWTALSCDHHCRSSSFNEQSIRRSKSVEGSLRLGGHSWARCRWTLGPCDFDDGATKSTTASFFSDVLSMAINTIGQPHWSQWFCSKSAHEGCDILSWFIQSPLTPSVSLAACDGLWVFHQQWIEDCHQWLTQLQQEADLTLIERHGFQTHGTSATNFWMSRCTDGSLSLCRFSELVHALFAWKQTQLFWDVFHETSWVWSHLFTCIQCWPPLANVTDEFICTNDSLWAMATTAVSAGKILVSRENGVETRWAFQAAFHCWPIPNGDNNPMSSVIWWPIPCHIHNQPVLRNHDVKWFECVFLASWSEWTLPFTNCPINPSITNISADDDHFNDNALCEMAPSSVIDLHCLMMIFAVALMLLWIFHVRFWNRGASLTFAKTGNGATGPNPAKNNWNWHHSSEHGETSLMARPPASGPRMGIQGGRSAWVATGRPFSLLIVPQKWLWRHVKQRPHSDKQPWCMQRLGLIFQTSSWCSNHKSFNLGSWTHHHGVCRGIFALVRVSLNWHTVTNRPGWNNWMPMALFGFDCLDHQEFGMAQQAKCQTADDTVSFPISSACLWSEHQFAPSDCMKLDQRNPLFALKECVSNLFASGNFSLEVHALCLCLWIVWSCKMFVSSHNEHWTHHTNFGPSQSHADTYCHSFSKTQKVMSNPHHSDHRFLWWHSHFNFPSCTTLAFDVQQSELQFRQWLKCDENASNWDAMAKPDSGASPKSKDLTSSLV